jgi:hypothetical protein
MPKEKQKNESAQQNGQVIRRIEEKAIELLKNSPTGLRFGQLRTAIVESDHQLNPTTIGSTIVGLETKQSELVYKPSKGAYRLRKFAELDLVPTDSSAPVALYAGSGKTKGKAKVINKVNESDFYIPFTDWLINEVEDVTHALPLGGNAFRDKWGTPDVIGKKESKTYDVIKGTIEIVSAEIKIDTNQIITAFGQACAYKLFSHKVYLVVPRQAAIDEISRLDSLCQIFGIGLVTFDADEPTAPDFRIMVRASKHEPDLFYTNKYVSHIKKQLFP